MQARAASVGALYSDSEHSASFVKPLCRRLFSGRGSEKGSTKCADAIAPNLLVIIIPDVFDFVHRFYTGKPTNYDRFSHVFLEET